MFAANILYLIKISLVYAIKIVIMIIRRTLNFVMFELKEIRIGLEFIRSNY